MTIPANNWREAYEITLQEMRDFISQEPHPDSMLAKTLTEEFKRGYEAAILFLGSSMYLKTPHLRREARNEH